MTVDVVFLLLKDVFWDRSPKLSLEIEIHYFFLKANPLFYSLHEHKR